MQRQRQPAKNALLQEGAAIAAPAISSESRFQRRCEGALNGRMWTSAKAPSLAEMETMAHDLLA
ncbi:MAG: hypothetical protein WA806_19480, partial [Bradyrhizobium sp.]